MTSTRIDVGKDFSDVPAGRFPEDGPYNGEKFRVEHLVPALDSFDVVEVVLDNTEGFGSSFLEEAFGGLIRTEGRALSEIDRKLRLIATKPRAVRYKRKIEQYLQKARPGDKGEE